eukprot:COSAG05_NODE_70_length_22091_cov_108.202164_19_plen_122_part_00
MHGRRIYSRGLQYNTSSSLLRRKGARAGPSRSAARAAAAEQLLLLKDGGVRATAEIKASFAHTLARPTSLLLPSRRCRCHCRCKQEGHVVDSFRALTSPAGVAVRVQLIRPVEADRSGTPP